MQHILRTDGSTRLHSVSSRESYSIGLCVNLFTVDAPFGSATSAHRAAGFQHHDIVITTLSRSAASRSRHTHTTRVAYIRYICIYTYRLR